MNMNLQLREDLDGILADPDGWAEDVELLPAGSEAVLSLRAIFDRAGQEMQPGSRAPVLSRRPVLTLAEADLDASLGRALGRSDRFRVRGVLYAVESPQPDGLGSVAVKLLASAAQDVRPGVIQLETKA